MKATGYSGTPLIKKLGLKEGFTVRFVNPPQRYFELLSELPSNLIESSETQLKKDFIHYFTKSSEQLHDDMKRLKDQLKQNGMLWISWPKKTSKIESDLYGNAVRSIGLKAGLIDIKVCAIDKDWSALKFVIPTKERY